METYEVILIDLNKKDELSIQVEVDEAEISENFVIRANIKLAIGYGMKCNGSQLNAVQSGMMGATDKVYLVNMGKQALMEDIEHIWDYANIDTFPDSKQQKVFFEQWIKR